MYLKEFKILPLSKPWKISAPSKLPTVITLNFHLI